MGKVHEVQSKVQGIYRKNQMINKHEKIHSLTVIW